MATARLRARIEGQEQSSQMAEIEYCTLVPFIVHFRRITSEDEDKYKGGFGFDWMRDDFKEICTHHRLLEKEYEVADFKYNGQDNKYFIPWLSVPANYSSKLDQKVKLQLEIEFDDKWKKSEIEFECPQGITLKPSKLDLKKGMVPPRITINCSSTHNGGAIIVKTVASKKEPTSEIVGKMNVVPNKEHPLKVRIVSLIRKGCESADRQKIADKINDVTNHITDCFLKQALITPSVEKAKEELIIDDAKWQEDKHVGKRIDNPALSKEDKNMMIKNGKEDKFEEEYNNAIVLYRSTPIYSAYREQFKDSFEGIIIILSDFTHFKGAEGEGAFNPTYRNEIIIYNISKYSDSNIDMVTVSHEIGHVLGLAHIFETNLNEESRDTARNNIDKLEKTIDENNRLILEYEEKQVKYDNLAIESRKKRDYVKEKECLMLKEEYKKAIEDSHKDIDYCKERVAINQKYIDSYDYLNSLPYYGFKKYSTDNIMDYNRMGGSSLICFFRWQWDRMRDKIKTYHS